METIKKVINIKKPHILEISKPTIHDWSDYNFEYKNVLEEELNKLFSETYNKLCIKYQKMLGRTSWLDVNIKPTKRQYIFDFWDIGDTENIWNKCAVFSGSSPEHKKDIVCQLIITINWITK